MQALSDRTLLIILLVVVLVTLVFTVFIKDENGQSQFGLPKFGKAKKSGKSSDTE
jgi:uncharacterized membrane protein